MKWSAKVAEPCYRIVRIIRAKFMKFCCSHKETRLRLFVQGVPPAIASRKLSIATSYDFHGTQAVTFAFFDPPY